MADEVEITNVGGNGVASEVTLVRLVAAMEAMSKANGGKGGAGSKTQALANKAIADGTQVTTDNTKATVADTSATKKAAEAAGKFASVVNNAALGALGAASKSILNFGQTLLSGQTSIEAYASQIPVIGSLLGPLAGYIDNTISSFQTLAASGAGFGNSLIEVRKQAAGMGLSLSEFTSLISQNAGALSSLGGSVTDGAKRFASMNKTLKATGDFSALKSMGFTVEEINEGMTDYIELQARMGTLQGRSTQDLAASSADYMKQVDLLAKVTGKTRKEAEAALNAQAADAGIRGMLQALGEGTEEFKNLQVSLAMIDEVGGAAGAAMKDLIDGMPSSAETGQFLSMLGDAGPEIQNALKKIGEGADPKVLQDAMKQAGGKLGEFADMDAAARKQYIDSIRQANPAMAEFLDASTKMVDMGSKDLEKAKADQAAADEMTSSAVAFEDSMRKVQAAINKAFVESGILEAFVTGLTTIVDFFSSIGETFGAAGVIAALVAGITALFAAKAVTGALASKAGGAIKGRALGALGLGSTAGAPASPAGKSGSAGKGAGDALGNIGKGLGKGLGGVLKGLAGGISAFANPAVLLGGVNLGIVILAIGAAVAGATWLMGKALPTFAEGMMSFQDLDGAKLIEVGKGIGLIGLGMVAMGGGGVVGAIGSVVSGIASFFGADSPIDKLKEFSKLTIDTNTVNANSAAMLAMGSAFANFAKSDIGSISIDDDVVDAFKALSKIGVGLGGTAESLQKIAGITGLQPVLNSLKFDADGVNQYNTAMEKLVDTLGELNEVLAEDNKGMFGGGSGVAAKDALGAVGSSTSGGSEGMNQLNTIMTQVLTVLNEMRTIDDKIEKNTKNITANNLATGYVSNTG